MENYRKLQKIIVCYIDAGPAKWISKWRGHATLKSIVGLDDKKIF